MKKMLCALLALVTILLPGCEEAEKPNVQLKRSYEYSDGDPFTPEQQMVAAAGYGDLEHIKKLQAQGMDLNVSYNYSTPLGEAAENKQMEVLTYLLDNGVDPDFTGDGSRAALDEAVWSGWFEGVKLLIDRGAKTDGPVKNAESHITPYFSAIYTGRLGLAQYLLDNGADGSYRNGEGYNALFIALDRDPPGRRYNRSPFYEPPSLEPVKFALDNGADINGEYYGGITPLIMAAVYQNREAFNYLVSRGADASKKDRYNNTPDEYLGFSKIYPSYLFRDYYEDDALFKAISPDIPLNNIRQLVEHARADVNERNFDTKLTPLGLAAVYKRSDIYNYLVLKGADTDYTDSSYNRPEDYLSGDKRHTDYMFKAFYDKLDGKEPAPAKMHDKKPVDYYVMLSYPAGNPIRLFVNGTLAESASGEGSGFFGGPIREYLKKGDNKVQVTWGALPGESGWDEKKVRYIDAPGLNIRFEARYDNKGDELDVVFDRTFGESDVVMINGVKVPAYEFFFHHEKDSEFTGVLATAQVCNATPEEADENIVMMRAFARELYRNVESGRLDWVVKKSRIRLNNNAASSGDSLEAESKEYRKALTEARKKGLAYKLTDIEQIVMLPTAGGRLWKIVVMESPEAGKKLMEEVKMLSEAAAEYDYDLIQTKSADGLSMRIPCQIARIGDGFEIVR